MDARRADPEHVSRQAAAIALVGFDGDDTLWHSEGYYRAVHDEFERILGAWVDLADARLHERLLATERRNLRLFGYGAKGMTLSMLETAIELTGERIGAGDLHRILQLGKSVLEHPVELIDGIRAAVEAVAATHRIVLITKGDLFHRIEIVSEKEPATYRRVLSEFDVPAESFAMVGNSLRSDIEPVVALGGWGVHMPYHVTWAHELDAGIDPAHPRFVTVSRAADIPAALAALPRGAA